jgi:hypothetical protein
MKGNFTVSVFASSAIRHFTEGLVVYSSINISPVNLSIEDDGDLHTLS